MAEAQALVRSLTPEQRAKLEETITSDPSRSLWVPSPGRQALAYHSQARELFYGGAAGGGKSHLLIGLALTAHQRTLVIRRESTQLRGILDDMAKILGTRSGLDRQNGRWIVPAEVALFKDQLFEFGGVPDPGSEEKHQGIAHDLLAFDEVTQLSEYIIDYLSSWNRSTHPVFSQRCRRILTSNPPTPSTRTTGRGQATGGGLWLISRYAPWLDPQYRDPHGLGQAAPGELRHYVTLDGTPQEWPDPLPFYHTPDVTPGHAHALPGQPENAGADTQYRELIVPQSRTFIPARVTDNPYLAGTDYESTLQKLPEPLRSAMLYGDFSVSLGDQPLQLIPTEWYRAATARWEALRHAPAAQHPSAQPMTALAADVSRGGGDKTVFIARHGEWFAMPEVVPSAQTLNGATVAGRIVERRRDGATIIVDAAGVGASVYDHLRNNSSLQDEGKLIGYMGSKEALTRDRSGLLGFANKRSESFWRLRDWLDPATSYQLALPPHDHMMQEILALTWSAEAKLIKVLPKEKLVQKTGRSSDYSDALVMALSVRDDLSQTTQSAVSAREARLAEARADAEPFSRQRYVGPPVSWGDAALPYPTRY